jgi:hypothetical protein
MLCRLLTDLNPILFLLCLNYVSQKVLVVLKLREVSLQLLRSDEGLEITRI